MSKKHKTAEEQNDKAIPPSQNPPEKKDVPEKPEQAPNPSGNKDNEPEEQISG